MRERDVSVGVKPALAAYDASDCLRFEKTQQPYSIDLEAKSACESKLECSLDYSVRCESREGKTTSRTAHGVRFSIDAGRSAELSLSAEACKQSWTIDDVRWSCHTVPSR
ncbi:MAG TPA: hypothetical protein VFQ35_12150 [Polyangiaceae bacterium]|nr:hypothetical protein [Polyangiaceae bacterium]